MKKEERPHARMHAPAAPRTLIRVNPNPRFIRINRRTCRSEDPCAMARTLQPELRTHGKRGGYLMNEPRRPGSFMDLVRSKGHAFTSDTTQVKILVEILVKSSPPGEGAEEGGGDAWCKGHALPDDGDDRHPLRLQM